MRIGSTITAIFLTLFLSLIGLGFLVSENANLKTQLELARSENQTLEGKLSTIQAEQEELQHAYQSADAARIQLLAANDTLHWQVIQLQEQVRAMPASTVQGCETATSPRGSVNLQASITHGQDDLMETTTPDGDPPGILDSSKFLPVGLVSLVAILTVCVGVAKLYIPKSHLEHQRLGLKNSPATCIRVLMTPNELRDFVLFRRQQERINRSHPGP
ncbi:MAG: hypothetical protein WAM60_01095 [Candidatus Promineifilaceae bacterium]